MVQQAAQAWVVFVSVLLDPRSDEGDVDGPRWMPAHTVDYITGELESFIIEGKDAYPLL